MDYRNPQILHFDKQKGLLLLHDDFEEIRDTYFRDLIEKKSWFSLPGGVQLSQAPSYPNFPKIELEQEDLVGYKIDASQNLDWLKRKILPNLSRWEGRKLDLNEFTICPSTTLGLNVCFHFLKGKSITKIIHETPAYFASVKIAQKLGFNNKFILTFEKDKFCITQKDILQYQGNKNQAIFLTQPKIGLGNDRDIQEVQDIHNGLDDSSFLIIDEAADRTYPSFIGSQLYHSKKILRIKGFYKGLGLNGIKASVIFHHKEYKKEISSILEMIGGTMDSFSIKMILEAMNNSHFLQSSLNYASSTISKLASKVHTRLIGSRAKFMPLENAYLGLIKIPFPNEDFFNNRTYLLEKAKELDSPIVLASSMYFPYDGKSEWIRFNFFSTEKNVLRSVDIIDQLANHLT